MERGQAATAHLQEGPLLDTEEKPIESRRSCDGKELVFIQRVERKRK